MGQSIPVGPWPDYETAEAFGGNALRAAADSCGKVISEWSVMRRNDGLWMAAGFIHPAQKLREEGVHVVAGAA